MKPQNLIHERPTETIPIPIGLALTIVLSRFLKGDAELAGAAVTIGLSVMPALITFVNVKLKKRSRHGR